MYNLSAYKQRWLARLTALATGLAILSTAPATAANEVLFQEDFESAPLTFDVGYPYAPEYPAGWTGYNLNNPPAPEGLLLLVNFYISNSNTSSSATGNSFIIPEHTQFALIDDDACGTFAGPPDFICDNSAVYLQSPSFDLSGVTGTSELVLIYQVVDSQQFGELPHEVQMSLDGEAWETIYVDNAPVFAWREVGVSLEAARGHSDVRLRWKYNDGGGWALKLAVDDVKVANFDSYDLQMVSLNYPLGLVNVDMPVTMTIKNLGRTVESFKVSWEADGTTQTAEITAHIPPLATITIDHPIPFNSSEAKDRTLTATITEVNGEADVDSSNNSASSVFTTTSQLITRALLFETGTGTWCPWCPRDVVTLDYMKSTYPDFIGIAAHAYDPMELLEYREGLDLNSFPGGRLNRGAEQIDVSVGVWDALYNQYNNQVPTTAEIFANPVGSGADLKVDVQARFYSDISLTEQRLGVILVHDDVMDLEDPTVPGYGQFNNYAGGANGPMGGFENLGDYVTPQEMQDIFGAWDDVGIALLGGFDGEAGSIPAAVEDGSAVDHSFLYTIPADRNKQKMKAVAVMIDQRTGEIMDAAQISLASDFLTKLEVNEGAHAAGANCTDLLTKGSEDVGDLCLKMESTNLVVTFTTKEGYELRRANFWAGEDHKKMKGTHEFDDPREKDFPYKSGKLEGTNTYEFRIPIADLTKGFFLSEACTLDELLAVAQVQVGKVPVADSKGKIKPTPTVVAFADGRKIKKEGKYHRGHRWGHHGKDRGKDGRVFTINPAKDCPD